MAISADGRRNVGGAASGLPTGSCGFTTIPGCRMRDTRKSFGEGRALRIGGPLKFEERKRLKVIPVTFLHSSSSSVTADELELEDSENFRRMREGVTEDEFISWHVQSFGRGSDCVSDRKDSKVMAAVSCARDVSTRRFFSEGSSRSGSIRAGACSAQRFPIVLVL